MRRPGVSDLQLKNAANTKADGRISAASLNNEWTGGEEEEEEERTGIKG